MSDTIQADAPAAKAVVLAQTPLRVAALTLRVRDAARVGAFYRDVVGLSEIDREGDVVRLGAGGRTLVELRGDANLKRREPRSAGLFHTAFLQPTRSDLAAWVRHAAENRFPIVGASDHAVSEAIYLNDPEGNGVEIYADRPSAEWPNANGQIAMTTEALDVENLLAAQAGRVWRGAPDGLVVGHMHLQVGALGAADGFYRDVLGFDIACRYPGASFYGAGGYHHQIAANIWNSRNAGTIDESAAGLAGFEITAQDEAILAGIGARAAKAGLTVREGEGTPRLARPLGTAHHFETSLRRRHARRGKMERRLAAGAGDRRQGRFRPADLELPQLGDARRQARPDGRGRLRRRSRPLSPLCRADLPLGVAHADRPQAQAAGGRRSRSASSNPC